jgi:hypothetical protein
MFWILIVPLLYTFVTGYGPVQGVDNFRTIPGVSNNTWSPTLYSIHKDFDCCAFFFLIGLIDNVLFTFCIQSQFALKAILWIISLPNKS